MKTRRFQWTVGLTAGVIACGALAYTLIPGGATDSDREPNPVDGPQAERVEAPKTYGGTPTPRAADRQPTCRFEAGQQVTYRLEMHQSSTVALSQGRSKPGVDDTLDVEQTTRATVDLQALGATDAHTVLVGQFRTFEGSHVRHDERLETPFLLRVSEDCETDGFAYFEDTALPYARVQQALLFELQWRWPTDRVEDFEGRNSIGTYEARVATRDDGGRQFVDRRIFSYEPWASSAGNSRRHAVTHVDDSFMTVATGAGPWFDQIDVDEKVGGASSTTRRRLQARRVETVEQSLEGVPTDESRYVWTDLLPQIMRLPEQPPMTAQRRRQLQQARTQKLDDVLVDYEHRVADDNVGIQNTWPPLRTYLEARPDATDQVVERLAYGKIAPEATMGVYIALGNARTPEAKQALTGIMKNEDAPAFERTRAALSLVDRADVDHRLARYLSEQSAGIDTGEDYGTRIFARHAMLALGAMSGRHSHDPQIREIAVRSIEQSLGTLSKPMHLQPVFGALANVGDPELLGLVEDIPSHPDPEMREFAAVVIRRMPPEATGDFAARWLAGENDWNVKRKLYGTLEMQSFLANQSTTSGVIERAIADLEARPGPITRKAIIRLLGRAMDDPAHAELGIDEALLRAIPYELEQQSGLYPVISAHIDDNERLAQAAQNEVELAADASGHADPDPSAPSTAAIGGAAADSDREWKVIHR